MSDHAIARRVNYLRLTVDQLEAHQRAQAVFAGVLAQVSDDQLDAPSPCVEWTAKDVIEHVIGGNQWVRHRAGLDPVPVPDDRDGQANATAAGAQEVFAAPDGLTRTFSLPFGDVPGAVFLGIRTADVYTHAWDLAKATGQSTDLDPAVGAQCLDAAKQFLPPTLRGAGKAFGDEQSCPPDRPVADQLAAFLGRRVD